MGSAEGPRPSPPAGGQVPGVWGVSPRSHYLTGRVGGIEKHLLVQHLVELQRRPAPALRAYRQMGA